MADLIANKTAAAAASGSGPLAVAGSAAGGGSSAGGGGSSAGGGSGAGSGTVGVGGGGSSAAAAGPTVPKPAPVSNSVFQPIPANVTVNVLQVKRKVVAPPASAVAEAPAQSADVTDGADEAGARKRQCTSEPL